MLPSTTIGKVAARLESDIRQRNLRPGDRYLTALEASKLFSVSSMTMHRAMQSLAERELLVRQRSRGTYVGPKFRSPNHVQHDLDIIHVVMAMEYHVISQAFSSDALVDELTRFVPDAMIEIHHTHERGELQYVEQILKRIGDSRREGFILIRCSRAVQSCVSEAGIPAVVLGQVYPEVQISCVAKDQESTGRLMAQYALEQEAREIALLTHARWRLGDSKMVDAITETLGAAGIRLESVKIRSVIGEREVIEQVVRESLEANSPDAFLCRSDYYAQIVHNVINGDQVTADRHGGKGASQNHNTRVGRPCIVSGGHSSSSQQPFAKVISTMNLREELEHLTDLLSEASADSPHKPRTVVVPVEFYIPQ